MILRYPAFRANPIVLFCYSQPPEGCKKGDLILSGSLIEDGRWDSSLFNLRGLWKAYLFPHFLVAQIVNKLDLTSQKSKTTACLVFILVAILEILFAPPVFDTTTLLSPSSLLWREVAYSVASLPLTLGTFWAIVRVRATMRSRYRIRSRWWYEDFLCIFFCHTCAIAQMARQGQYQSPVSKENPLENLEMEDDCCHQTILMV